MKADIMILAPHPDDAEIAMGGTIAAMQEQGAAIVVVDLTNGEPTPFGSPEIRAKETVEASRVLGIKERVCLDLGNRVLVDGIEQRREVAGCIRRYRPDILFIPYGEDAHPDHMAAAKLCISARFYAKLTRWELPHEPWYPKKWFHFFSLHFRPVIQPSLVFDVSKWFQLKRDALACYHSQFIEPVQNRIIFDRIEIEAKYWGSQSGCAYAEPFVTPEPLRFISYRSFLDA